MRAFSTIELLVAFAIGVTSITGALLIILGVPDALAYGRHAYGAYTMASMLLTQTERREFDALTPVLTSSTHGYDGALSISYLHEDVAARLTTDVRFTTVRGKEKEIVLESIVTHPPGARNDVCSPFILRQSGREPQIYYLTGDGLLPGFPGQYPVSDITVTRDSLLVSVSSTVSPTDPTLFILTLGDSPLLTHWFDNASTSRTGYVSIASDGEYVYAANGFGSASAATCATGACGQLHVFSLEQHARVASLTLPAQAAGGITAPAKSILYHHGYVYLGLEKTQTGQEFTIIDVHDPDRPHLRGGVGVGRSVNDMSAVGNRVYLATSDPDREFVVLDIEDLFHPRITEEWNAPGSTNFGVGNVVRARGGYVYAGRTYVGNAPELSVFREFFENPVHQADPGTTKEPRSVNGMVVRATLLAVLAGNRFEVWDREGDTFSKRHELVELPGIGTSLTCRGQTYYIGGVTDTGEGYIAVI